MQAARHLTLPVPDRASPRAKKVPRALPRQGLLPVRLGAVAAAVTALALFTVFIHCQVAVMGYRVLALQEQVENLENENRKLELSIAALSSLDRVQEVASSKLGMCMPAEAQVVAMAADVAAPPAPAAVHQGQQDVHTGVLQQAYERLSKTLARSKVVGMNE